MNDRGKGMLDGWAEPVLKYIIPLVVAGITGLIMMYGTVAKVETKLDIFQSQLMDAVGRLDRHVQDRTIHR